VSIRLFDKGRQGFIDGSIDWDTDTIKTQLMSATADTGVKAITGATNASPIVITATSHGYANGDIVVVAGVGGNTAANGTWQIANQATNTFELRTVKDNLASTGNGSYTSGGVAVDLTLADNRDDVDAGVVGTDQTLGSKTVTNGVIDAADVSYTALTGAQVLGVVFYKSTGSAAADRLILWMDGKTQVVVAADAASSATTLWVEPLEGPIASGTAIIFSNGITATTTSSAAAGARSLAVSAISGAIAAGHTADVATTSAGFPFTPSGGDFTLQFDNGANKIAKI
jgi:hypothetical protein